MKKKHNLFRQLLKYGMPVFLLLFPLVALYGQLNPWPPAQRALSVYPGQTPIMVGFGYQAEHSSTGNTKRVSRCYILFPMVMSHPKIITVHQVNDAEPIVSESEFGFVFYVVWLLVCLVGTWWFWFRPLKQNAT